MKKFLYFIVILDCLLLILIALIWPRQNLIPAAQYQEAKIDYEELLNQGYISTEKQGDKIAFLVEMAVDEEKVDAIILQEFENQDFEIEAIQSEFSGGHINITIQLHKKGSFENIPLQISGDLRPVVVQGKIYFYVDHFRMGYLPLPKELLSIILPKEYYSKMANAFTIDPGKDGYASIREDNIENEMMHIVLENKELEINSQNPLMRSLLDEYLN